MNTELLKGNLVRLGAFDPEIAADLFARWNADSEYQRLLDWEPALRFSKKASREWLEKNMDKYFEHAFLIRTLEDDRPIGEISLSVVCWNWGDAYVGIGLGERADWGKGYGTDAMQIILRYAFMELDLHRVSLDVFEYNLRGIRSYEKCGFVVEGRERALLQRDGRRWDVIYMGILKEDWLKQPHPA